MAIIDYTSEDNPQAAQALKDDIEKRVAKLPAHPLAYREGRAPDTREMVVRPNYIVVYNVTENTVTILSVLHAAQMWP